MTIFRNVIFVLLLVMATGVFAQTDPDPDGLGIYFDQGATVVAATAPEGTVSITAYLILTNPSFEGILTHWSARVSSFLVNPGLARIVGSQYQGFNLALNMPGSDHWTFEISVYQEPPFPTVGITLLAELTIYPYSFNEPINLYVSEGLEIAGYSTDVGGAYMNPSSGNWELPVAVINGLAPVAVESRSWGQIKSIFR